MKDRCVGTLILIAYLNSTLLTAEPDIYIAALMGGSSVAGASNTKDVFPWRQTRTAKFGLRSNRLRFQLRIIL
jgi:hypothetical protein